MKLYARVSNGILLPLMAGVVALAWYSSRGTLSFTAIDALGTDEYFSMLSLGHFVSLAGFLVGGILAVVGTPWASLCVGLFLTATGLAWLGFADPDGITVPFYVATLGRAMATIGLWGALAKSLDGKLDKLRDAAFLAAYVSTNIGAMALNVAHEALMELPPGGTQLFAAVLMALAFMGALALAVVAFVGREPAPEGAAKTAAAKTTRPVGPLVLALGLLCLLVALPNALGSQGYMLSYQVVEIDWLNPVVVIVAGVMMTAVLTGLHFAPTRVPTTLSMGPGLLLWGAGIVMILLAVPEGDTFGPTDTSNEALATAGTVVNALGEIMLIPLLYSRLSTGLPYRLNNVVLALFLILSQLPYAVANLLTRGDVISHETIQRPFGWLGALSAIVFGLVIAVAAWPTRKVFWPPEDAADDSEDDSEDEASEPAPA